MRAEQAPRPLQGDCARVQFRKAGSLRLPLQSMAAAFPASESQFRFRRRMPQQATAPAVSRASAEAYHRLHVKCLGKKIEQVNGGNIVTRFDERSEIARERRRIAR